MDNNFVRLRTAPTGKPTFRQDIGYLDNVDTKNLVWFYNWTMGHNPKLAREVSLVLQLRGVSLSGFRTRLFFTLPPDEKMTLSSPPPLPEGVRHCFKMRLILAFYGVGEWLHQNYYKILALLVWLLLVLLCLYWTVENSPAW